MADLDALLSNREQLARRLETIEAALADLQADVAQVDEEISRAKLQRTEMVTRGRRMYAILQEARRELERYDGLIKDAVDAIANTRIGNREGACLIGHGMIIARTRTNGALYTAMVQIYDDG